VTTALHPPLHLVVRALGNREYAPTWAAMQAFTAARTETTVDEIWWLEHPPVYTLGRNAKHPPTRGEIPIVQTDRGGDVTYHGPGQLVVYPLLDLRRLGLGVKAYVQALEQSVIALLADYGLPGEQRSGAPGVYVQGRKIAALGLRVRERGTYHGLALNIAMDLAPFRAIRPCGYADLQVTQLADLGVATHPAEVAPRLVAHLQQALGYNAADSSWAS
jgi:lipoyl(octanoyl) transferase